MRDSIQKIRLPKTNCPVLNFITLWYKSLNIFPEHQEGAFDNPF